MKDSQLDSITPVANFYVRVVERDGGGAVIASRKALIGEVGAGGLTKCPTIHGGSGANDGVTIQGTSNGSPGSSYVILQPNGKNVGIGTTAPGEMLELAKSASGAIGPIIKLRNTGGGASDQTYLYFATGTATNGGENRARFGLNVLSSGLGCLDFYTKGTGGFGGTPDVRIAGGDVGIGTASPGFKLEVNGTLGISGLQTYKTTPGLFSSGFSTGNIIAVESSSGFANQMAQGQISLNQTTANANDITAKVHLSIGGFYHNAALGIPVYLGSGWVNDTPILAVVPTNHSGAGNVGIGTTTPGAKLHVIGTTLLDGALTMGATGTAIARIRHGVATLAGGTVTVSDSSITTSSRIFLTAQSLGTVTVPKPLAVTARTASTSFTITSADNTDTSVVAYEIIEP